MEPKPGRVDRRNRPPVSCEPCRSRKLKCNRNLPCETCIKRQKTSQCHYAANANRNASGVSKHREMKDRLNTLENLVSSLLSGDSVIQPAPSLVRTGGESLADPNLPLAHEPEQVTGPIQRLTLTPESGSTGRDPIEPEAPHMQQTKDGQVNYIDPSHWHSILQDIHEIREHLDQPMEQSLLDDRTPADASFLFGAYPIATGYSEILTSLPSKAICDKLVSLYLRFPFLLQGIIHPEKFQLEYEAFWAAPTKTSPLWTALLFSIIALMVGVRRASNRGKDDDSIPSVDVLQQKAVQCLVLGNYATANAHALEALFVHGVSFLVVKGNRGTALWFQMGTVIRLAFRMGYHRDPSHLARVSVFDGEMRRRLWLNIVQVEALMSAQMGFPSMIPTDFCDTKLPQNLDYSDLQIHMDSLPPGRPLHQYTPVRYAISKDRVMSVYKKIATHNQCLAVPIQDPYEKIIVLHHELHEGYNGLTEALKRRDVSSSSLDSAELILERSSIELLFYQGLILLHRRYTTYDPTSHKFEFSRRACVEAALDILRRHEDMCQSCEPGGRLHEEKWIVYETTAYATLLAAMVICLDMSLDMRLRGTPAEIVDKDGMRGRQYQALVTSQRLLSSGDYKPEVLLVSRALELMIRKVEEHQAACVSDSSTSAWQSSQEEMATSSIPSFHYASAMSQIIDGSEDLDWALLDQYLQNLDGTNPDTFF